MKDKLSWVLLFNRLYIKFKLAKQIKPTQVVLFDTGTEYNAIIQI